MIREDFIAEFGYMTDIIDFIRENLSYDVRINWRFYNDLVATADCYAYILSKHENI
jgi:hypothetical protein